MDKNVAIKYILENARPLELAIYKYYFENESSQQVPNSEWLVGTTTEKASFYENIGFKLCDDVFLNIPCKGC